MSRTAAFDQGISKAGDALIPERGGVHEPHGTTVAPVEDCQKLLGEQARASLGTNPCVCVTVGLWSQSEAAQ